MIAASAATAKPIEMRCFIDSAEPGYRSSVLTLNANTKTVTEEWLDGYQGTNLAIFRKDKVSWANKRTMIQKINLMHPPMNQT